MTKRIVWLVIVAVLLMSCGSAAVAGTTLPKHLSLGACGTAGTFYLVGAGVSQIIEKYLHVSTTAEVTACAVENTKLLHGGKIELGILTPEVADQAYRGITPFTSKQDILALAPLYPNLYQLIVPANSPIQSIMDIKGKRVSVGAPGSGILESNKLLLDALGLKFTDFKPEYLSFSETAEGMKNGWVDAAIIVTAAPSSWVLDLESVKPIRVVPLTEKELNTIVEKVPYYVPTVIPKGRYKSQDYEVRSFAAWNVLAVRKDVPDDVVYELTKAIMEHNDELAKVHKEAANIRPENASTVKIPYHPGAAKYYKEIGITVH
ncbi:MAG: TAXI family TRAP transporter solute-binding subunit [Firmicutes bacterium]|jgi:TRAP transporter TAXI family solute receptor|nr:TAXI family TRAP transporter solute-binding subunit [Bacillota bacterium]MDH7495229.1 TAXI family TRAP transporter solute-binding subunit [Bacillota bacterium]